MLFGDDSRRVEFTKVDSMGRTVHTDPNMHLSACTVEGAGSTAWKGSNFDCANSNNVITLLHSHFAFVEGARGLCNN